MHHFRNDVGRIGRLLCVAIFIAGVVHCGGCRKSTPVNSDWKHKSGKTVKMKPPRKSEGSSLSEVLNSRRSRREFTTQELNAEQLSQLCWAAQGVTGESGKRTAPSAGALYPVTILVADHAGVWEYLPESHALRSRGESDIRKKLQAAALDQSAVGDAPACFIITFDTGITAKRYGSQARQYCLLEAGHVAQNLLLTAESLKLAAVPIGAAQEKDVASLLGLPSRLEAIYLIPVGQPK